MRRGVVAAARAVGRVSAAEVCGHVRHMGGAPVTIVVIAMVRWLACCKWQGASFRPVAGKAGGSRSTAFQHGVHQPAGPPPQWQQIASAGGANVMVAVPSPGGYF